MLAGVASGSFQAQAPWGPLRGGPGQPSREAFRVGPWPRMPGRQNHGVPPLSCYEENDTFASRGALAQQEAYPSKGWPRMPGK